MGSSGIYCGIGNRLTGRRHRRGKHHTPTEYTHTHSGTKQSGGTKQKTHGPGPETLS